MTTLAKIWQLCPIEQLAPITTWWLIAGFSAMIVVESIIALAAICEFNLRRGLNKLLTKLK